jgi:hypothetical protein
MITGTFAPRAWAQELRSNRRLQVGVGALPVLLWLLWPSGPQGPVRRTTRAAAPALAEPLARDLRKLPDLARLDRAGELPGDDRLYRDLFLFEAPPVPAPPPPPPPPATPEQLAAQALEAARAREYGNRPQWRYLGFLGTARSGPLGAFMKGDEPLAFRVGDRVSPGWELVKLADTAAEFRNLTYPDLRHRLDAVDARAGNGSKTTNAY